MADNDVFTEVTQKSWFGRLGGSLMGALIGLILFAASFPVLYWNEGRAVDAAEALGAGRKAVVSVAADTIDPANNGKLVHLTSRATVTGKLTDPAFRVGGPDLLRLERHVEMFQWREHKESKSEKNVGGSETTVTTYRYTKEWAESAEDSANFKQRDGHINPTMAYQGATFDAAVKVGAFTLEPAQVRQISAFTPLVISPDTAGAPPAGFHWLGEWLYRGRNADEPAIGDLRVKFRAVPAQILSVVAAQADGGLATFHGRNDYDISLVKTGVHDATAMFASAQADENIITWILRGVGFFMMFIGVMLVAGPLSWLASLLPFLATLVDAAAAFVALMLAAPLTLLTIALAWIAHRPLLGGGLILAGVLLTFVVRKIAPRQRPAAAGYTTAS